jgi:hypothetical protein
MIEADEIRSLVDRYRSWLKDRTVIRSINDDWVEITTPFLDRHNDCIQIYARREERGYRLTDDRQTITDLELSGCLLDTPKRKALLRVALNGYGVQEKDGVLSVTATPETFAARKHALIQAILAVNDLFYTASSVVRSLFKEDVAKWLDFHSIRHLSTVTLMGHSGYPHQFDFAIPKSSQAPERILRAINNPNKDAAESMMFAWLDSRENRDEDAAAYAVLNDNDRSVTPAVIDALKSYEIEPLLWSQRDAGQHSLAA